MAKGYSTFDAHKAIGIKYQRFRGWLENNYIVPSIRKADGVAVRAELSKSDIYLSGLFKELTRFLTRDEAKIVLDEVLGYSKTVLSIPKHREKFIDADGFFNDVDNIVVVMWNGSFPKDKTTKNGPMVIIYGPEMYKKPIGDLLSLKGYYKAEEYTSQHMVNFKKIRESIDAKLS